MSLGDAVKLAVRVLGKALDTAAPSADKMEVAILELDAQGAPVQRLLSKAEVEAIIKEGAAGGAAEAR